MEVSVFPDDMFMFLENSKLTRKWLAQNCGYKMNLQISITFAYTSARQLKNKKSGKNAICNNNIKC